MAEEFEQQILADAEKHRIEKQKQVMARHRASSEATEVISVTNTMTESFQHEIIYSGVHFTTVKCFHPRKGESSACLLCRLVLTSADGLGTTYLAEPVCEDSNATIPLELHVISFDSEYYSSNQGRSQISVSS